MIKILLAAFLLEISISLQAQDKKVPPEPEKHIPTKDSVIIFSDKPGEGIRRFNINQKKIKVYIHDTIHKELPFTISFNNKNVKPQYIPSQGRYLLNLFLKNTANILVFSIAPGFTTDTVKADAWFNINGTPVHAIISCSKYSIDTFYLTNTKQIKE
jgi:hypothetical protein